MLAELIQKTLANCQEQNRIRKRYAIETRKDNYIQLDQKNYLNFASNDYLGMTMHPEVMQAFIKGVEQFGLGSGSSAIVAGFYHPQQQLEEKFARFMKREQAILFNSGYHANLAVLTTFPQRHQAIIADKLSHASLLDGIKLSRAKFYRYPHQDILFAEKLLQQAKTSLLVTESVFSMEGDITPVDKLALIAKNNKATFIVDDAHGIGVLGSTGRGVTEYFNLAAKDIDCLVTPLGKAIGSMGAIVSGEKTLMEGLVQFANSYRYTTALPPAIAFATITVLDMIEKENWRIKKLNQLIQFFVCAAKSAALPLISTDLTPIKSILVKDNKAALRIKDYLAKKGLFVSCIRPPTVPKGTARIRISLNCLHQESDINYLLNAIAEQI